jgi:hypothetical protein
MSASISEPVEHIETVRTDAQGVAYALVRGDVACVLTIRRAIELQQEGVPYVARHLEPLRGPKDFASFYH